MAMNLLLLSGQFFICNLAGGAYMGTCGRCSCCGTFERPWLVSKDQVQYVITCVHVSSQVHMPCMGSILVFRQASNVTNWPESK